MPVPLAAESGATQEDRLAFLAEASATLGASLDYETTITSVARLAVPVLADWCAVDIVGPNGEIDLLAVAHVDEAKVAWARELRRRYPVDPAAARGVPNVLRTGQPELYPLVTDETVAAAAQDAEHLAILRAVGFSSAMIVPLAARGEVLGALTLVSAESDRRFNEADLAFADLIARRCAVAIDNARLYRQAQLAEAGYRTLFEGAADALLISDARGRYRGANQAAVDLLGWSREELQELDPSALIAASPERIAEMLAEFERLGSWSGEIELRRKDGTTVPVEVRSTMVELPTGPARMSALRDISERRAVERLQREFIAMVTHDLKAPLTSLKGYAQLMQRKEKYVPSAVATILTQTARMERLINDLLDVARLESGQLELRRSRFDLRRLVEDTVAAFIPVAKGHPIRIEAPPRDLVGTWDADRIGQVLQNLLTNAIKYSPAGGAITVTLEADAETVAVAVRDQGIGIPPDEVPRLFRRFYRVGNAAGQASGLGLGLYISRLLVEAHGGRIAAESVPGRGSTFRFSLPRHAPDDDPANAPAAPDRPRPG